MDKEEIIYELHLIRREVASNYEDLDFTEYQRDEINKSLKDALLLLGEND